MRGRPRSTRQPNNSQGAVEGKGNHRVAGREAERLTRNHRNEHARARPVERELQRIIEELGAERGNQHLNGLLAQAPPPEPEENER